MKVKFEINRDEEGEVTISVEGQFVDIAEVIYSAMCERPEIAKVVKAANYVFELSKEEAED